MKQLAYGSRGMNNLKLVRPRLATSYPIPENVPGNREIFGTRSRPERGGTRQYPIPDLIPVGYPRVSKNAIFKN